MKLSLTFLTIAALFQSAIAFAPIASVNRIATAPTTSSSSSSSTAVFADGDDDDDDEAGLDLNLEEMFDMFDAADKGEDFDDAIDKVKGN